MARSPKVVDVKWEGGYRFTSADAFGHTIQVDAPIEKGAPFTAFKPGELMLTALAACTGIDVVNILNKQRHEMTGMSVKATGQQQEDPPWTYRAIHLEYTISGREIDPDHVERAIQLSEEKYCSIGSTLSGKAQITHSFQIVDSV
ncbi:MAG: OsmC family protein [SAR202 cluster bacterium]|nr:OsmC family protein [SAR202 cluster bacterium]